MSATDDSDDAAIARIFEFAAAGAKAGKYDTEAVVEAHVALGFGAEETRAWLEALHDAERRLDTSPESAARVLELGKRVILSHADPEVRFDLLQMDDPEQLARQANKVRRALKAKLRASGLEGRHAEVKRYFALQNDVEALRKELECLCSRSSAGLDVDEGEFNRKLEQFRALDKESKALAAALAVRAPSGRTER